MTKWVPFPFSGGLGFDPRRMVVKKTSYLCISFVISFIYFLSCTTGISVADPGFPVGGRGPRRGGVDSRGSYVSKNLYVKMRESGPLGGRAPDMPPSRSVNAYIFLKLLASTALVLKAKETNTVV